MNNLIKKFQNQSISPDIESICNQLVNSGIDYDERQELFECLELKLAGNSELLKTTERYNRYLRGIDVWDMNGISYEYIRINIKKYLSIEINEENLLNKLKMMRKIDKQLKAMIEQIEN